MTYRPVFTFEQLKKEKERQIRKGGADIMLAITTPYTAEERDTWPIQVAEAKAYDADNNASIPMIDALVAGRGNTKADQVARILANEAAFKMAVGQILGIQQAKIDLVHAATTTAEVVAVTW